MKSEVRIDPTWKAALREQFASPYWDELSAYVKGEYKTSTVYPPPKLIFNAFDLCPFETVKVVILGQDPYHGAHQAHGLCFSVPDGVRPPPSLQNVYKELHDDLRVEVPQTGNLEHWAKQGVLLLNATLTVRAGQPGSHQGKGWEQFTDAAIKRLSDMREHLVFMLWGNYAKAKGAHIDRTKHLVLEAAHPSPYSAYSGFFGCKHFSKANDYLRVHNVTPVDWGHSGNQEK
jgi:uracil-DNA glycosylase